MPTHRIPILVWEDREGFFTATPVEPITALVGTGTTARSAIGQVKQYLEWSYGNEPWMVGTEIKDEQLKFTTVDVRPVYHDGPDERRYPCDERLALKIPCVVGTRRDKVQMCSIPTFQIAFDFYSKDSLEDLVAETIRGLLSDKKPSQLLRMLPPKNVRLDRVSVRVKAKAGRNDEFGTEELAAVTESLLDRAAKKRYENAWMRDAEVRQLTSLLKTENSCILLVGERGVGKTTLLAEAARAVRQSEKQGPTREDRYHNFYMTNAGRLIAGMQYLGEWQQRCEEIVDELSQVNGVLCVENLLDLVRTGGLDATDSLAAFFRSFTQHGELRLVCEVTPEELTTCERLLPGFTESFRKQIVEPLPADHAISALGKLAEHKARQLSTRAKVELDPYFVETAYRLFRRFLPYQSMPGPAAAFVRMATEAEVDQLIATTPADTDSPAGKLELTIGPDVAREAFGKQTGLPKLFLRDDMPLEFGEVYDRFRSRVIGQDTSCQAAADVVMRFKAGLNDPTRPVSVQLFCGPTGVGKTQLAKEMSQFCFGHGAEKDRLIRVDMSEYSGWGAAERLLDTEGTLMQSVRQQPFVVVLLDEIEKAASDVFDVLLSLFEEGVVSDKWGRRTWFRSAMVVMTSNLGADTSRRAGFGDNVVPAWEREVERFFRPEFVNRIDEIVTFDALSKESIRDIAKRELESLERREGLREFGRKLHLSEALIDHVASCGFDIRYGARPLQRFIERHVVAPLSKFLLAAGDSSSRTIQLDYEQQVTVRWR